MECDITSLHGYFESYLVQLLTGWDYFPIINGVMIFDSFEVFFDIFHHIYSQRFVVTLLSKIARKNLSGLLIWLLIHKYSTNIPSSFKDCFIRVYNSLDSDFMIGVHQCFVCIWLLCLVNVTKPQRIRVTAHGLRARFCYHQLPC